MKLDLPPSAANVPEAYHDFRNFLARAWHCLGLRPPTVIQYNMAFELQHGPSGLVLLCWRNAAKSWISGTFCAWNLLLNPNIKVLMTSASDHKCGQLAQFVLKLLRDIPECNHLIPLPSDRSSSIEFDVNGAATHQMASVTALPIGSNAMNGARSDLVLADDVETLKNSETAHMKKRVHDRFEQLDQILQSPQDVWNPRVLVLGTPQDAESLYFTVERDAGYKVMIYPARYPTAELAPIYGDRIAPLLQQNLEAKPELAGTPVDDDRFPEDVLLHKQSRMSQRTWELQYLILPSLSNTERYPLHVRDCPVMDLDIDEGPDRVIWTSDPDKVIPHSELPCAGFTRDRWFRPAKVGDFVPYQKRIMAIDPSGGGPDECAFAVVFAIHNTVFLMDVGGFVRGNDDTTMEALAQKAVQWRVKTVLIEKNMEQWIRVFRPFLRNARPPDMPIMIEEVLATGVKHRRLIDSLDTAVDNHRLVLNAQAIRDDFHSTTDYKTGTATFRMVHQMARLADEHGCLEHEDRLEAVAMGVKHCNVVLGKDVDTEIRKAKERALDDEIKRRTRRQDMARRRQGWQRPRLEQLR